jgi:hypothetical protein
VMQVLQRIAAPQRDRVGEQGGGRCHRRPAPDGPLVKTSGPQIHGEKLDSRSRIVTVGAQVVATSPPDRSGSSNRRR